MSPPKDPWGTCRHCNNRVVWKKQELSEEQKAENAAAAAQGKRGPHSTYFLQRWTHAQEKPGEDLIKCPDLVKLETREFGHGDRKGEKYTVEIGPRAEPKEWCNEHLQNDDWHSGGLCNRKVKHTDDRGKPYCGLHWAPIEREKKRSEAREQHYEIQSYVRNETEKLCKALLEDHGLEARPYSYQQHRDPYHTILTGEIVVDPQKLLDILEAL